MPEDFLRQQRQMVDKSEYVEVDYYSALKNEKEKEKERERERERERGREKPIFFHRNQSVVTLEEPEELPSGAPKTMKAERDWVRESRVRVRERDFM